MLLVLYKPNLHIFFLPFLFLDVRKGRTYLKVEYNISNRSMCHKYMKLGIIYAIYNKETGLYYVGSSTTQLNKVWKEHLLQASKMNPSSLYKSIRQYGAGKHNIRVIEECAENILSERESYWISEYNSLDNGYNEPSEDVVEESNKPIVVIPSKPTPTVRDYSYNKGSFFSVRGDGKHKRIKVKTINVITLEETFYDSIKECAKGLEMDVRNVHSYIKNGWKCKGHRIIKLEDKPSSYAVYGVDKVTNKVLHSFRSVSEAARELGTGNSSGVDKSLKHPHKYTWKGCYWFYQ